MAHHIAVWRVRLAWWIILVTGGNGILCRIADRLALGDDR